MEYIKTIKTEQYIAGFNLEIRIQSKTSLHTTTDYFEEFEKNIPYIVESCIRNEYFNREIDSFEYKNYGVKFHEFIWNIDRSILEVYINID